MKSNELIKLSVSTHDNTLRIMVTWTNALILYILSHYYKLWTHHQSSHNATGCNTFYQKLKNMEQHVTSFDMLQHIMTYFDIFQHIMSYFEIFHQNMTYFNILWHILTYFNTLWCILSHLNRNLWQVFTVILNAQLLISTTYSNPSVCFPTCLSLPGL